jgi:hypothetical protein
VQKGRTHTRIFTITQVQKSTLLQTLGPFAAPHTCLHTQTRAHTCLHTQTRAHTCLHTQTRAHTCTREQNKDKSEQKDESEEAAERKRDMSLLAEQQIAMEDALKQVTYPPGVTVLSCACTLPYMHTYIHTYTRVYKHTSQVESVMKKAQKLLDQEEGTISEDQKDAKSRPEGLPTTLAFLLDGMPPAQGVHDMHTSAEAEALRLAEEAALRSRQTETLEHENARLKSAIMSLSGSDATALSMPALARASRAGHGTGEADDSPHEMDWTLQLADPVLAARYRGADIRVRDYDRTHASRSEGDATAAASRGDGVSEDEAVPADERLAYALLHVGGGLPVSRAQVLDREVSKRVAKAREGLERRIEAANKRIQECKEERDKVRPSVLGFLGVCVCVCACVCAYVSLMY